jgi:hypothetical protein
LILADARHVLLGAQKNASKLRAADRGRSAKLFAGGFDSFVSNLASSIRTTERSVGAQAVSAKGVKAATATEKGGRDALFVALVTIRDDIALSYPSDKALAEAFGVGARIARHSTPKLLAVASTVLEAYAQPVHRKAAAAAGVTPARMRQCARLRDTLASADASQNAQLSVRKGSTAGKRDALSAIARDVAHLRKVAKHVLRGDALALAAFASTRPRRVTKKRAKPPAATASS